MTQALLSFLKLPIKIILLCILQTFLFSECKGQTNLLWHFKSTGSNNGHIGEMLKFPNGDVLVQGFNTGGDMDPGPGTTILNTMVFFARYTPTGNLVFCRPLTYNITSTNGSTWMTMDSDGSFYYVVHPNSGMYDFDPAPGVGEITTNDGDIVVKFDSMGNYQWSVVYTEDFFITGIEALNDNSVVISGYHQFGTGDLDPGVGIVNINTYCSYDGFIVKFDSSGTFITGKQFVETAGIQNNNVFNLTKLSVDDNNNIYIGGSLEGTFDADPGPGVYILDGTYPPPNFNGFLIKLDNNLDFVFANGVDENILVLELTADPVDGFFYAGIFDQPVDIDPFPGVTMLNTDPNYGSMFIAKFDSTGHLQWAKTMKTTFDNSSGSTMNYSVDENGFSNFVMYVPGTIVNNSFGFPQLPNNGFTSSGFYKVQLDTAGTCVSILRFPEMQNPNFLIADQDHFFVSGRIWGPTDIQLGYGLTPVSPSVGNEFMLSYYSRDLTLNRISGNAFIDLNSNSTLDSNENGLPYLITEINPGSVYLSTDNNGYFETYVPPGNYAMKIPNYSSALNASVPLVHVANFSSTNQIDTANNFAFTLNVTEADMAIYLTAINPSRPGMNTTFNITCINEGAMVQSGDIKALFDTNTTYISSTLTPVLVNGQQIHWSYSNLNPLQSVSFTFTVNVDSLMQIGDTIETFAEVLSSVGDNYVSNNTDSLQSILTASSDPNSKEVYPVSDISDEQVSDGVELTYIINFQNVGNDTAFFVTILDTLSESLDIGSLRIIASSHIYYFALHPGNIMEFRFDNILLPDSNTNEMASHGFVKYKIKADSTLLPGDFIENHANIYFDFNLPVTTNATITNVVDFVGVEESDLFVGTKVYPNPFADEFVVKIPNLNKEKVEYTLCDITGKVIRRYESFTGELKINVENISRGIYFLKIRKSFENGIVKVVKM